MKIAVFSNGERGSRVMEALSGQHNVYPVGPDEDCNSRPFWAEFASQRFDLGICAGFSQILKKSILDLPKYGFWNCHAGPVPKYRGGSPLNWQIIDGAEFIGISLLQMDEGIDTGPVISRTSFLRGKDNIAEIHEKVNALFPHMVLNALSKIDDLKPEPQPESKAYNRQRSDADGEIDLSWKGEDIVNFVDALCEPYPGAFLRVRDGKILRIWKATIDEDPKATV